AAYTQDEQRARRRQCLSVVYGQSFDLATEIAVICAPLAVRVAATPNPKVLAADVEVVVAAAHEAVGVVVGLLAEAEGGRHAGDIAKRPPLPEVTEAHLVGGVWLSRLTSLAEPFDGPLSSLLGRSIPPGDDALRGHRSVSERLEDALRVLDRAALTLARKLTRIETEGPKFAAAKARLDRKNEATRAQNRAREARAALADMGSSTR
ncbi:MAG: hypothetical protein QG597_4596, partial [Actinomycetota bacterium]|nr:hypothetical protein [Actinomycetota bacterium]